ncbi:MULTISPECIES: 3-carboxy-cis,cis-muconate cycloisomerase [unclassified Meiothermus]|uniref:3-carboxy-cis,cis-muconate cycloisomerase n=1 Tax=unclassified Meiothermus TaxID=370471 RepID=UPI000D7BD73E|nr:MULTISPECIES: 3-carboxy-cis,cis-muconate cycloisomerase [unclassified Meiothermus]PZA07657.1 3-carboxy-cis,cis-muconate cycloisomerase [Meiothermus sp. Pnk-1]RYM36494.1 3-carboxy-cis,cis-muconate cycloisomerase [Meiothermus sp. PNK-Is4]
MPFLPSESRLFERLYGEPALAELFRDERWVGFLLEVEVALAKVQGELGIIPPEAAAAIGGLQSFIPDWEALARQTERDGVPIAGLVTQLRKAVGSEHGPYLHWGATTQDILDTAFILQARSALGLLEDELRRTLRALAGLARRHRHTLMAGRTHAQQALPITFGFKVAGWMAPLLRDLERLEELKGRLLVVQLGGAVGTLAALGEEGVRVVEGLARELGLGTPPIPWHTARDNLAELAGWLSLLTGSLAKMAQDVILLAQSEVGEVSESAEADRGGSSTLPQKSNPVRSEVILASARANAALLSAVHQALIAEHERATHGWQLEWLTLPQMFSHTAAALHQARCLSEGMVVHPAGMQANLRASRGLMLAEAISFALAEHMDRDQAKALVREAARAARSEGRHLVEVVRERVGFPLDWEALSEEGYLGSSQLFIDRVLQQAEGVLHG